MQRIPGVCRERIIVRERLVWEKKLHGKIKAAPSVGLHVVGFVEEKAPAWSYSRRRFCRLFFVFKP
ncbi:MULTISPECIES: hypothetical protein [Erythrobacteraceae]|jgi:hypothetical protein|nr:MULTISPECIES: hypothetical protein [Erythrobacteraceae]MCP2017501.1 hypothetical protein [Qipengyuania citrea]|tara:strand:+ start:349 stop:546 length:198 start_codon:yes stop_codon:yes gene_type:complete